MSFSDRDMDLKPSLYLHLSLLDKRLYTTFMILLIKIAMDKLPGRTVKAKQLYIKEMEQKPQLSIWIKQHLDVRDILLLAVFTVAFPVLPKLGKHT